MTPDDISHYNEATTIPSGPMTAKPGAAMFALLWAPALLFALLGLGRLLPFAGAQMALTMVSFGTILMLIIAAAGGWPMLLVSLAAATALMLSVLPQPFALLAVASVIPAPLALLATQGRKLPFNKLSLVVGIAQIVGLIICYFVAQSLAKGALFNRFADSVTAAISNSPRGDLSLYALMQTGILKLAPDAPIFIEDGQLWSFTAQAKQQLLDQLSLVLRVQAQALTPAMMTGFAPVVATLGLRWALSTRARYDRLRLGAVTPSPWGEPEPFIAWSLPRAVTKPLWAVFAVYLLSMATRSVPLAIAGQMAYAVLYGLLGIQGLAVTMFWLTGRVKRMPLRYVIAAVLYVVIPMMMLILGAMDLGMGLRRQILATMAARRPPEDKED